MSKLYVEAEGRRFTVRYSRRETVIKLLEANADKVEEVKLPDPPKKAKKSKKR